MKRKNYTILLLTPRGGRFRKLHLSRYLVWGIAAGAVLLLLASLSVPRMIRGAGDHADLIASLTAENLELREEQAAFEESLTQISGQLNSFEAQTARLATELGVEDLPSSRPAVGGDAAGQLSGINQELGALDARSENLDLSLAQLDQRFHERIRLLSSTPASMPIEGWFSHGFGWRNDPWTGKREFHKGIDIVADAGTEIAAPADGVVSRAGRNGGYGKTVDLSHGYGYVTRYAHMSEILVRPGQRIRKGDVLGRVGSTGRSTGPHLHYEVFRDGRRVNPWKYLGQKGS